MNMAFREYLKVFMKLFLDDFSVFNDLQTHLAKLWLCFDKCWEFNISLNSEKCMFLVYSRVIFGYIISKAKKLLDLNASNLAVMAMLAQNPIEKCDQPITYASSLLNNVEKNNIITKRRSPAMIYATTLTLGLWSKQKHGKMRVANAT